MFCSKCGKQLPDNAAFCDECGTPVYQEQPLENAHDETDFEPSVTQTDNPNPIPNPKRKKGKKKPVLILACVILCIVAAVLVFINIYNGNLPNLYAKMTKSDAEYMEWVNKRDKDRIVAVMDTIYPKEDEEDEKLSDEEKQQITQQISVSLTDEGKEFLVDLGADEDEISWLDSASLSFTVNTRDSLSEIGLKAQLNESPLIDGSLIFDEDNGFYVSESEYLRRPIQLDTDGFYNIDNAVESMVKVLSYSVLRHSDLYRSYVNTEEAAAMYLQVRDLLPGYFDVIFENLTDVEKESVTLTASETSQKCTQYTAEIDYNILVNTLKELINMADDDDDLKDILTEYLEEQAEKQYEQEDEQDTYVQDALDSFYDALEDAEDAVDNLKKSDFCFEISYVIYVDSHGNIIGREIHIENTRSDIVYRIRLNTASAHSDYGFDLDVEQVHDGDSEHLFRLKGDGKVRKGAFTGELTVYVNDEKYIDVAVDSMDIQRLATGKPNGKLTVTPKRAFWEATDAEDMNGVAFIFAFSGSEEKPVLDISAEKQSECLVTVSIRRSREKSADISVPEHAIRSEDFDTDDISYDNIETALTKAGIPEEIVENIMFNIGK